MSRVRPALLFALAATLTLALAVVLSGCAATSSHNAAGGYRDAPSHNSAGGFVEACGELPPLLGDDC
jgi:hypothetical protein